MQGHAMGHITLKTEKNRDLTRIVFTGKVTVDTVIQALNAFYGLEITSRVLWDFSDCDVTALVAGDLSKMIDTAKSYARLRPHGKSALVGPNDLAYGLGRMYSSLSQINAHPVNNAIFRTVREALAWLDSED